MAKALYTPISIVFSVLGAVVAGAIFKQIWKRIAGEEESPKALESEYGWREVLPAAAAQGLVFGVVKAAIQRSGAKGFERLTGVWPGD
ncbi:MAG TPA: DUF4235 domain-containing protein [Thermoleophilaceae bacterium]|jgi:hypothetical protein|nr:DUF4235 domain-containing protein [Thermoleophilaceae bacterium]